MCVSPWAASRLSFPLMTQTEPSGRATRWGPQSASSQSNCCIRCATISHRMRCFISDKASGTPASCCRDGRSPAIGAKMEFPSGRIRSLIAEDAKDYGYASEDARKFLEALTRRLQVNASFAMAAYEDSFYYLWKERRLPVNVDPLDSKLENPARTQAFGAHFRRRLGQG